MSGVSNDQVADETTFNSAFLARNGDSSTIGKVDLNNTDPLSGSSIANIQRELNAIESYTGLPAASVVAIKPSWADNFVGLITNNLFQRINALVALFNGTTGHAHTGTDGDGPHVNAIDLASGTTESTDKDTGCMILNGGLGVEKSINAGSNIKAIGTVLGSNLSNTNTGDDPIVVTGTRAAPTNVTAAGGIVANTKPRTLAFVKGNTASLDITANPQIANGVAVGDVMTLRVPVGSNSIILENGNGLSQNGAFELGVDVFAATYMWDGTEWFLIGRD